MVEKPVIESKHQLRHGPGRSSFISGELKAGGVMFMTDWSAVMTPQNATLDRKRTLP